ncbi:MAG: flagellin [Defluviitaleaceae bacterium]|nr:flagellin [Defluviitaleaceae bacterium]
MSNMVVRTNIFALNAHRNMKNVGMDQQRATNRLSSGFRINSAADDAAGLAISENMRAQIRGLDQASRNAQDGQSMLLTTEGGLEEIGNMLQRVRELMVQASNDTNTQDQRGLIMQEISQLGTEILSMQNRVEFNTNRVLAMGPAIDPESVVEATGDMVISGRIVEITAATLNEMRETTLAAIDAVSALDATSTAARGAIVTILARANRDIDEVMANHGCLPQVGGLEGLEASDIETWLSGLDFTEATWAAGSESQAQVLAALNSRLGEINTAINSLQTNIGGNIIREAFNSVQTQVRQFVNSDSSGDNIAFFQVGANSSQGINFDFETVSRAVAGAGWTVSSLAPAMAAAASGSGIGSGVRITGFIGAVDASIDDISRVRANLGAVQNRMDFTMRSLDISSENLQDSESRVRNADVAREMMRFTMSNVLQQASVSMLSQANQMPQNLLQLLR